jgi:oxalate decarboxylase
MVWKIGLNTGEYQAIDLSQWVAATPPWLLADHFGKPEDVFAGFPKERAFISTPDGQGKREIK